VTAKICRLLSCYVWSTATRDVEYWITIRIVILEITIYIIQSKFPIITISHFRINNANRRKHTHSDGLLIELLACSKKVGESSEIAVFFHKALTACTVKYTLAAGEFAGDAHIVKRDAASVFEAEQIRAALTDHLRRCGIVSVAHRHLHIADGHVFERAVGAVEVAGCGRFHTDVFEGDIPQYAAVVSVALDEPACIRA